jgi:hypothetical protein
MEKLGAGAVLTLVDWRRSAARIIAREGGASRPRSSSLDPRHSETRDVDLGAAVHHHLQPRGLGALGRRLIDDAELAGDRVNGEIDRPTQVTGRYLRETLSETAGQGGAESRDLAAGGLMRSRPRFDYGRVPYRGKAMSQ